MNIFNIKSKGLTYQNFFQLLLNFIPILETLGGAWCVLDYYTFWKNAKQIESFF